MALGVPGPINPRPPGSPSIVFPGCAVICRWKQVSVAPAAWRRWIKWPWACLGPLIHVLRAARRSYLEGSPLFADVSNSRGSFHCPRCQEDVDRVALGVPSPIYLRPPGNPQDPLDCQIISNFNGNVEPYHRTYSQIRNPNCIVWERSPQIVP